MWFFPLSIFHNAEECIIAWQNGNGRKATIINRLMGKGKDFKRNTEKLIEFYKNVTAQNYCKNKAAMSTTLLFNC